MFSKKQQVNQREMVSLGKSISEKRVSQVPTDHLDHIYLGGQCWSAVSRTTFQGVDGKEECYDFTKHLTLIHVYIYTNKN